MFANPFTDEELGNRLETVRAAMAERRLDMVLLSTPENIFYLTGLDHWGYFAPHLLVVPPEGEMVLITRQMERVSIERQVRNALFQGHADNETAADLAVRFLKDSLAAKDRSRAVLKVVVAEIEEQSDGAMRIGVETWSSGHSYGFGYALRESLSDVHWVDITGLVDELRLVKSPAEQALMRKAAAISDAAATAAIDAINDGVAERDVVAECHATMIRAGGEVPGFGPFIRPGPRLGEEHATWGNDTYRAGEPVFIELSGCVSRYHAPLGRLVHVGSIREEDARMAEVAGRAFDAVLGALRHGTRACDVYAAWQAVVDEAGLAHHRRHHCGYCVGIGFPPSWTGGNRVTGLRHDSDLEIREGMTFHILSWLMGTGKGDFFVSNAVLLGPGGAEVLTKTPLGPTVKE
ncbi:Xaa-Pro peptidase family protein [Chelativorans sp. M5D2P16]|uniref:Xaa-Pro peptidase family protein n=1 Tax=Chelativorans sp. M5D2P16 TaxID=3095678 RepID=UPI002ACA7C41|nr:Xaa-Pro peptidase family protein [Chelativorans sp. M5D2P16]MDZ5696793.1 Xaa-Pro peptidase family protein [Chelativorans sp. M5D2P16]